MRRFVFMMSLMACMYATAAYSQNTKKCAAGAAKAVPFNGVVCNQLDQPIKKARIYVLDPMRYAQSDKQGRFGLTDVKCDDTLHVIVGKLRYDVPVEGRRSIRLRLMDQQGFIATEDQKLVDIGYAFVKKREFTGASSGITGEELQNTGFSDLLMALRGKVPGLSVDRTGSDELAVSMRGTNSVHMPQTPLYIVDGVMVESLSNISVYDVDRVEVLKEAALYGSRGANGAIIVHTKH